MNAAIFVILYITAASCSDWGYGDLWKDWDSDVKICGKSLFPAKPYSVAASSAQLGEFPWMVNVGPTFKDIWSCGGFLVTDRHIVTGATCLDNWTHTPHGYKIEVQIGDLNVDPDVIDGASPTLNEVEKFIVHEEYNPSIIVNDIGIIQLKNKVNFTDQVRPICLPLGGLVNGYPKLPQLTGEKVKVAGWGTTEDDGEYYYHLREVNLEVTDLAECKRNMTFGNNAIDERVVCAAGVEEDACKGFSGTPLMYYSKGNWFAVGITSYGNGCAREGFPGVYTNVEHFSEWIVKTVKNSH